MTEYKNLRTARKAKNDEFYTRIEDVTSELQHYEKHFEDKTVLCNCDDPTKSAFWEYFHTNFAKLGLKKLISTYYDADNPTCKMEYFGKEDGDVSCGIKTPLAGNGDFRSGECVDILKGADIVVTNPPFSLFREHLSQLMVHKKKFLIIGSQNAISYKEVFSMLKNNEIWLGYGVNRTLFFRVSDDYSFHENITNKINDGFKYCKVPSISWFTNLDISKRHEKISLREHFDEKKYPHYENYDAINVDRVKDIPIDYDGVMGVPITFLNKYNPEQFDIIGLGYGEYAKKLGVKPIGEKFVSDYFEQGNKGNYCANNVLCCYRTVNGEVKIPYARILIRRIG